MVGEEVFFLVSVIELLMKYSDLQRINETFLRGAISLVINNRFILSNLYPLITLYTFLSFDLLLKHQDPL